MVEGVPGAGVHGPRDKIVDEFLAPVRGLFVARRSEDHGRSHGVDRRHRDVRIARQGTLRDGRAYNNRYAWSIDVRDGRIFAIREYMDSHYVATLFGGGA